MKKTFGSKKSIVLDGIGIFGAASLLFVFLFQGFIVKLIPSCYYGFALIGFVKCGEGFWNGILGAYLMFFSPFHAFGVLLLLVHGLGVSLLNLKFLQFFVQLLYLSLTALVVFAILRMIIKICRDFFRFKERKKVLIACVSLFLICLPSVMAQGFKMYAIPASSSDRVIEIDMWHTKLAVPRSYLYSWSLTDIPRSDKKPSAFTSALHGARQQWSDNKPSAFISALHGARQQFPSVVFDVSPKQIQTVIGEGRSELSNGTENLRISVSPHYDLLTDKALQNEREKIVKFKTHRTRNENNELINDPPLRSTKHWDIYRGNEQIGGSKHDIYVAKDDKGEITNILKCVSDSWCIRYIGDIKAKNSWQYYACESAEECQTCERTCADISQGNNMFFVAYSFDKDNLEDYFKVHQDILSFIESFSPRKSTKNAP